MLDWAGTEINMFLVQYASYPDKPNFLCNSLLHSETPVPE